MNFTVSPNPFNDAANIEFELKQSGTAKIIIVDVTGKQIELFNGFKETGKHKILLNAAYYKAGIYSCLLYFNNDLYVKKIVLLK